MHLYRERWTAIALGCLVFVGLSACNDGGGQDGEPNAPDDQEIIDSSPSGSGQPADGGTAHTRIVAVPSRILEHDDESESLEVWYSAASFQSQSPPAPAPIAREGQRLEASVSLEGFEPGMASVELIISARGGNGRSKTRRCVLQTLVGHELPEAIQCRPVASRENAVRSQGLATLSLHVVDEFDRPLQGAIVYVDGELVGLTGHGKFSAPGQLALTTRPGYRLVRVQFLNRLWEERILVRIPDHAQVRIRCCPKVFVPGFLQLAAGRSHSLGIWHDFYDSSVGAALYGWGANGWGQVGCGTCRGDPDTPVQIGSDLDWWRVEAGDIQSVGIKLDGSLWGWGANSFGELGDGTTETRFAPVRVCAEWTEGTGCTEFFSDVRIVSTGKSQAVGNHTLAIKEDGTLWAWGHNAYGQLGTGSTSDQPQPIPVQVGSDSDWRDVAAGANFTVALKQDGTLWAWGRGDRDQLGLPGSGAANPIPVQVGTDANWDRIAVGQGHAMALKSDGRLWAWGWGADGQLGLTTAPLCGLTPCQPTPAQVGADTDWSHIAAGLGHSLAVKSDGTLWAWGGNIAGQLGMRTTDTCLAGRPCSKTPQQVGIDSAWTRRIGAGGSHSLGVQEGRFSIILYAWGNNRAGQLGNPNTTETCGTSNFPCSYDPLPVHPPF